MKLISIFLLLFFLSSCGKSAEEEIEAVLTSVENFLTKGECEAAQEKLESIDAQDKNAFYIKIKASVYACLAGYKSATFIEDVTDSLDASALFSSLTLLSTSSSFSGAGDDEYDYLQTAIETLAFAGDLDIDENPTHALRRAEFTSKESTEISSMLLFLTMTQIGKFSYYYGDTGSTGIKGAGSNDCFFGYSEHDGGNMGTVLAATGGNCSAVGLTGHNDLDNGGVIDIPIACEGIVLVNTFLNSLANIGGDSLSDALSNVVDTVNTLLGAVTFTDPTITSLTSRAKCEADFASNTDDLERFFAYIFEVLHNKDS